MKREGFVSFHRPFVRGCFDESLAAQVPEFLISTLSLLSSLNTSWGTTFSIENTNPEEREMPLTEVNDESGGDMRAGRPATW